MRFVFGIAKVFAVFLLFFVNSSLAIAQIDSIYRLPAGTRIRLRMDSEINSKVSSAGDTFTTTVSQPVSIRDTVVIPEGIVVEGRIVNVARASSGGHGGSLEFRMEKVRFAGSISRDIDGSPLKRFGPNDSQSVGILSVIGGAAGGALLGGATGSGKGILIGTAVGVGTGTGIALLRKGKNIRIKEGDEFEIELKKEVTLPVQDY